MNDNDDGNVFQFVAGGKSTETTVDEALPQFQYSITDILGEEYFAEGFAIFTSAHVAVMKETPKGAIPVLLIPLNRVSVMEIIEDEEDDQDELF